jgi:mRNA interferase MazF
VVSGPRRGDIWWAELEGVGRRPYLVLTRDAAIPVMRTVLVAPLTRTIRSLPSELRLGPDDGVVHDSVATFDNVTVISRAHLVERMTRLSVIRMDEACSALRAATSC